jgi:hypothetical protein
MGDSVATARADLEVEPVVDVDLTVPVGEARPAKKRKYRAYDLEFKLKVVQFAKGHTKARASREFKVDRERVVQWCKKETSMKRQQATTKGKRQR